MKNSFKYIIFFLALMLMLLSGCSCGDPSDYIFEDPYTDIDSNPEISVSDISETDAPSSIVSDADVSESTQTTTTVVSETTISTAVSTTAATSTKVSSSGGSDDSRNAAGVYKPDYKEKYYIVVHTGSQSVAVYGKDDEGFYNQLIKSFTCSTGKKGSATRTGAYKVRRKYRWRLLVGNVYGQYNSGFSGSYLFHSVPYLKKSVNALDDKEYDKLGSPASHGCIRLCVRDAKWIYDNCPIGTQVYVTNTSGPAGAGVPARNKDNAYSGWDPSDKWASKNPYFNATTTTTESTTVSSEATSATESTSSTVESSSTTEATASTTTAKPTSATTSSTAATTTTTESTTVSTTSKPTETTGTEGGEL